MDREDIERAKTDTRKAAADVKAGAEEMKTEMERKAAHAKADVKEAVGR